MIFSLKSVIVGTGELLIINGLKNYQGWNLCSGALKKKPSCKNQGGMEDKKVFAYFAGIFGGGYHDLWSDFFSEIVAILIFGVFLFDLRKEVSESEYSGKLLLDLKSRLEFQSQSFLITEKVEKRKG